MTASHRKAGIVPNLLLAILMSAAQAIAVAHQFGHEKGSMPNTVCAACVAYGQLASAAVDNGVAFAAPAAFDAPTPADGKAFTPVHTVVSRQRSPPAPR